MPLVLKKRGKPIGGKLDFEEKKRGELTKTSSTIA